MELMLFGGLPASLARDEWNGDILLLDPRQQLRATANEAPPQTNES